jgi:hypothetical protein
MNTTLPLISQGKVAELLAKILGKPVTAAKAPPMNLKIKAPRVYGVYRDSQTLTTCLCVFDLPLSVHAAGVMLNFPGCTINDSLRAGKVDEVLLDTLQEILNICGQLFKDHSHQVFQQVLAESDVLPADVTAVLAKPATRLDLTVTIPGQGSGQMALLFGDLKGA